MYTTYPSDVPIATTDWYNMSTVKFLEEHDPKVKYPKAIRLAFADLIKAEGNEAWRYEQPLSTQSGVPLIYLQKLRGLPEFAAHIVETPRTHGKSAKFAWFVDKKVAAEMRNKLKVAL